MEDRNFTPDEIKEILKQVEDQSALPRACDKYKITPATIYAWQQIYGGDAYPEPKTGQAKKTELVFRGLAILLALIGLSFAGWSTYNLVLANASKSFPSTEGLIVRSQTVTDWDWSSGNLSGSPHPELAYEYSVAGKTYTSSRIRFGGTYVSDINQNPVGARVEVFYNAGDPAVSCLEPGVHSSNYFIFGTGLFWLGLAIFVLVGGRLLAVDQP